MAVLPTERLAWAEQTVDEVVEINGQQVLVTNKTEPPEAYKLTGILARERVGRARINWFFDLTARYINHLVERYAVGDVHVTATNVTAGSLGPRLGGTWVSVGSQTVGSTTLYYFRKSA